jgi:hypothetical protein
MPQTSVLNDYLPFVAGMCAYPARNPIYDTETVDLAAGIPFGRHVCRAGAGTVKLPVTATDVTDVGSGVSAFDETKASNSVGGYADNETIKIGRKGYFVVETETAVTKEAPVLVRHTSNGGNTVLGRYRAGADTGAAVLPNARWAGEYTSGLAVVELW